MRGRCAIAVVCGACAAAACTGMLFVAPSPWRSWPVHLSWSGHTDRVAVRYNPK